VNILFEAYYVAPGQDCAAEVACAAVRAAVRMAVAGGAFVAGIRWPDAARGRAEAVGGTPRAMRRGRVIADSDMASEVVDVVSSNEFGSTSLSTRASTAAEPPTAAAPADSGTAALPAASDAGWLPRGWGSEPGAVTAVATDSTTEMEAGTESAVTACAPMVAPPASPAHIHRPEKLKMIQYHQDVPISISSTW
jgi:hypothetical protein